MKPNKAPGHDGLPSEFYKTFWDSIKDILVSSYNKSFIKGEMAYSQRESILSLIFKKGNR